MVGDRERGRKKAIKKAQIINLQKSPENSIIFTLKSRLLHPCPGKTSTEPFGGQLFEVFLTHRKRTHERNLAWSSSQAAKLGMEKKKSRQ